MVKSATTQHTNDEVVLTPQQLAAYHSAGLTLQDQDGNFIGSFTAAPFITLLVNYIVITI